MCQAFPGRLPTEVMAERDRLPEGLLEEVVEAGAYERAYFALQQNPKASGGLVDAVQEIEFELATTELAVTSG